MVIGLLVGLVLGGAFVWLLMGAMLKKKEDEASVKAESLTRAARRASGEATKLRIELQGLLQNQQNGIDLIQLFPDLVKMIFSGNDSDEVVTFVNRACGSLLHAGESAVFLADRSGARLGLSASTGLPENLGSNINIGLGEGFAGLAAETGRFLDRADIEKESVLVRRNMIMTDVAGFKPDLAAPMQCEGVLFGVITVGGFKDKGAMRKETLRALAAVGAAALQNVRLLERFGRTSDIDPETGFSGRTSLESTLENELERVERFGSPLAAMELILNNASDTSLASREVISAAARHLRSALRGIDMGIRTGEYSVMILLPGTDQKGLDSVTGKLGGELPGIATDSGGHVGAVSIRGCVVAGGTRLSSRELLDTVRGKEAMDFEGYFEA